MPIRVHLSVYAISVCFPQFGVPEKARPRITKASNCSREDDKVRKKVLSKFEITKFESFFELKVKQIMRKPYHLELSVVQKEFRTSYPQ